MSPKLTKVREIFASIRAKYTSVGCYPLFLCTGDGAALCCRCARENARDIGRAVMTGNQRDSWYVVGADVNWEDTSLDCAHCGGAIESAYGDSDD